MFNVYHNATQAALKRSSANTIAASGCHFLTLEAESHRAPLTVMIGTDLQGFVSPHQDSDCSLLFVFQQLHVTGASLLPLWWVILRCKTI